MTWVDDTRAALTHDVGLPQPRSLRQAAAKETSLRANYVDTANLTSFLRTVPGRVMGLVIYDQSPWRIQHVGTYPVVCLDLPQLRGPSVAEVWTSDEPTSAFEMDGVHYATNGEIVFGAIQVSESAGIPLERTAYQAYRRLLAHMNMLGYPHLLRMWNYFPRINKDADGMERYRRFCLGRYEAMAECLPDFPGTVPAGTAIGTLAGPLTVYFLASRMPGQHLENPRQVNAYDYPQCYGPRSPSFARATLRVLSSESLLFISGTASVVGHASCHINDPHRQTRQILLNLDAVIRAADKLAPISEAYSGQAMFKVYLRQPEHVLTVADLLSQKLPPNSRVIYLQGDICRGDLLVEVEAILNHRRHEADVRRTSVSIPGITLESQHLSTSIR